MSVWILNEGILDPSFLQNISSFVYCLLSMDSPLQITFKVPHSTTALLLSINDLLD